MSTSNHPVRSGEEQGSKPGTAMPEYLKGSNGTLIFIVAFIVVILAALAVFSIKKRDTVPAPEHQTSPAPYADSTNTSPSDVSFSDVSSSDVSATDISDAVPDVPVKLNVAPVPELADEAVRAALEKSANKYGCSAVSIAVIKDGEVSSTYTYGNPSGANADISANTKIRVASLSKVIIGLTAMKMIEDGYFTLDQDIGEIAGFRIRNPYFSGTPITMRHLLCHTSTISSSNIDIAAANSSDPAWLPAQLKKRYPFTEKQPGKASSFEYSNSGYCVAGYLMELASKKNINEYLKTNFLEPLDIDAAFCASQLKDSSNIATLVNSQNAASSFSVSGQLKRPYSQTPGENSYPYAGDYMTSALDLARLVCILINDGTYCGHEFLNSESVSRMEEANINTGNSKMSRVQCITLKRFEDQIDGRTLYYHTGVAYGQMGYIGFDPVTKDGVVILTIGSMNSSKTKDVNEVCLALAEICFSQLCA